MNTLEDAKSILLNAELMHSEDVKEKAFDIINKQDEMILELRETLRKTQKVLRAKSKDTTTQTVEGRRKHILTARAEQALFTLKLVNDTLINTDPALTLIEE